MATTTDASSDRSDAPAKSATLAEPAETEAAGDRAARPAVDPEPHDGASAFAERWMPFAIAVAFVGVSAVLGARFGLALTLLLLAAGALLLVIALIYRAVMVLLDLEGEGDGVHDGAGESQGDAAVSTTTASQTPAEAQKDRALKALRDLEHEHAIGNTTEEDYATLRTRFREDAKDAMRAVDAERRERRAAAEAWIAAQRGAETKIEPRAPAPKPREGVSVSKPRAEVGAEVGAKARTLCWACDGANDDDAKFCKHCGSTLAAGEAEAR